MGVVWEVRTACALRVPCVCPEAPSPPDRNCATARQLFSIRRLWCNQFVILILCARVLLRRNCGQQLAKSSVAITTVQCACTLQCGGV